MKPKFSNIVLFFLLFLISCNIDSNMNIINIKGEKCNIFANHKKKIILVSNGFCCHDCIINLNNFINRTYKKSNIDFILLYEDPGSIAGRRIISETYTNQFNIIVNQKLFCVEDTNIVNKLSLPCRLFNQQTPYLLLIDSNQKVNYIPYNLIFNNDGTVLKNFKISL